MTEQREREIAIMEANMAQSEEAFFKVAQPYVDNEKIFSFAYRSAWQASAERKDKIIEQQAAEIAALREFASAMRDYYSAPYRQSEVFNNLAVKYGLIDKTGKPTVFLTGNETADVKRRLE